jgi:hypothetical protein
MTTRLPGGALSLILTMTAIMATAAVAVPAAAQTLPWPTDAPHAQPAQPAQPMAPAAAPMMAPMAPQQQQQTPECAKKFMEMRTNVEKLRENLDKIASTARSTGGKKASREDVCKALTAYAAAEGKWAKYTNDNVSTCGIPPQIAKQLSTAHSQTLVARKNVCAAAPAGAGPAAAPSLSDALGTSRMPASGNSQSGGSLNTLTGNAISR